MLQVTKEAIKKIKEELDEMEDVDTDHPFIRVYMALG